MQIPIDTLTRIIPGTQSGAGVRQKERSSQQSEGQFGEFAKAIEEAANKSKPVKRNDMKREESVDYSNQSPGKSETDQAVTISKASSEPKNPDEEGIYIASFAGMMGIQDVTFILEGDKDLEFAPQIRIEAGGQLAGEEIVITETLDEAVRTEDFGAALEAAVEVAMDETVTKSESSPEETAVIKQRLVLNDQTSEVVKTDNETNNVTGEAVARTPESGLSEQSDMENYGEKNPGSFESGGLSPLENENDNTTVDMPGKARKTKDFADTVEALKNASQEHSEPLNAAVIQTPLSEGIRTEQFRSTEQMTQAVLSEPVRTENLFDEMVSRIDVMRTESTQTMSIQLKPDFLGKVDLEIVLNSSGLHIRINADNQDVRSMVNSQINSLIESLTNKGIEVAEVEVSYTGFNNGELTQSRGEQSSQSGKATVRRDYSGHGSDDAAIDAIPRSETIEYYIDLGVSSVEYQA